MALSATFTESNRAALKKFISENKPVKQKKIEIALDL
jgi:hypothetical protein